MIMKSVLSIVAFTVTFGFSVVLVGLLFGFPINDYDYSTISRSTCADQTCRNIEGLIYQDIENGDLRDYKINNSIKDRISFYQYSEFVENYVDKSQSMEDANFPADFKASWRRHMKAWRDYSNFLIEQRNSSNKLSKEDFSRIDDDFTVEINKTWYETLSIGRSYGANVY